MRRSEVASTKLSEINELNQQIKEDRMKIVEKEISQIAESFYVLLKNLRIHKESDEVDSQISQSKIESLQCCISAEQIVLSCNRLMSLIEELKSIIVLNDFDRLYKTYSDEKENILKRVADVKKETNFSGIVRNMMNRYPSEIDLEDE